MNLTRKIDKLSTGAITYLLPSNKLGFVFLTYIDLGVGHVSQVET
jgi:hypothetical protein